MSWIKRQIANLAIAIGNVEKNTLGQENIDGGVETSKHQRLNQNSVMDALLRGEITEDVEKLRWRVYKTMTSMKNYGSKVIGYDEDGFPIMETFYHGDEERLKKIKVEPTDDYKLIMVVDNSDITVSTIDSLNLNIDIYNQDIESESENIINCENISIEDDINYESDISLELGKVNTVGELDGNEHIVKVEKPIVINRNHRPKFELENYTKKLHVKKINNKEFLLEFFVSKYPEQFNKKSNFFISEIKKIIDHPNIYSSLIDFKTVSFVTNNTIGVPDFLEFEYLINNFYKIVEFNEFYVIKFKAEVKIEANSIIEQFRNIELDEKYQKNEKR